ncbi:MAG: endolytic transglycosylase MltG [candidate division WOR-3 bacterium]
MDLSAGSTAQDHLPPSAKLVRLKLLLTAGQVASLLARRQLIRNPRLLTWWLRFKGKPRIAAGDYEFSPDQSLWQVADILLHERFTRNWVTFPEGWNRFRIARRLEERGIASAKEFLTFCAQPKRFADIGFPLPKGNLEGYLFPDTYRLPPGSGAEVAIRASLHAFRQRVYLPFQAEWAKSKERLHQTLIIASLIEKEARYDRDRPLIAAVIYNRLARGMPLQIDATVLYAQGRWKSRVLYRDLRHLSPYNTYLKRGLPPGPIANPGLASIRAALKPANVAYLYYVAQKNGYHRFSHTYEQHRRVVRELRGEGVR